MRSASFRGSSGGVTGSKMRRQWIPGEKCKRDSQTSQKTPYLARDALTKSPRGLLLLLDHNLQDPWPRAVQSLHGDDGGRWM